MTTGDRPAGNQLRGPDAPRAPRFPTPRVLRRRRHFAEHLVAFVAVNLLLVVVWLIVGLTSDDWFFWPLAPLVVWGLLLDVHAWWAYGHRGPAAPDRTVSS